MRQWISLWTLILCWSGPWIAGAAPAISLPDDTQMVRYRLQKEELARKVRSLVGVQVSNAFIEIHLSDELQLGIRTTGGDPGNPNDGGLAMVFAYSSSGNTPWSSEDDVLIDGLQQTIGPDGTLTAGPTATDASTLQGSYLMGQGIIVTKRVRLDSTVSGDPDTAEIKITLTNTDSASHLVGYRSQVDTLLGYNDGALLATTVNGVTTLQSTERLFEAPNLPSAVYDMQYPNVKNYNLAGIFTLNDFNATTPDKVGAAWWENAYTSTWNTPLNPNTNFVNYGDSCVLFWWDPISLAPGASVSYVYYYGISVSPEFATVPVMGGGAALVLVLLATGLLWGFRGERGKALLGGLNR